MLPSSLMVKPYCKLPFSKLSLFISITLEDCKVSFVSAKAYTMLESKNVPSFSLHLYHIFLLVNYQANVVRLLKNL